MDFSKMKVGESILLDPKDWDDSLRAVLADAGNYGNSQDPRQQFQCDRVEIGNKSQNPPTKDRYAITRIK